MKMTFEIAAKDGDGTKVRLTAAVESPRYVLTRDELRNFKDSLKEKLFDTIRNEGFRIAEIQVKH